MKKVKILFTIPNFDTAGSGRHMFDIAIRLNKDRFEPHIACEHSKGAFFKEVEKSGIPIHIKKTTIDLENKLGFLKMVLSNFGFFRKQRFNIIHSFHWASDIAEPLGAKLAGKKWLYTKKNMTWARKAWQIRTNLAKHIIIINPYMKDKYYASNNNVSCIALGVGADEWSPRPQELVAGLRQKLGIGTDQKVVGTVANLVAVKGVDVLIKAFAQYQKNDEKAILLVVGEDQTDHGRDLHELVEKLGIASKVIFTGKTMDVQSHLALMDLYVQPSIRLGTATEALGVATIEAITAGRLSIGSDVEGTRFVLGEDAGFLFEPGNEQELAGKIEALLNKPVQEKTELIHRQQARVGELFNIDNIVVGYEKVYEDLMA